MVQTVKNDNFVSKLQFTTFYWHRFACTYGLFPNKNENHVHIIRLNPSKNMTTSAQMRI